MQRLKIALFLSCVVMLTACGSNANSPEYTVLVQSEVYSAEKESDHSAVESGNHDGTQLNINVLKWR